ncbi:hypothetical protein [Endozoicomonas sp. 2B-B]
MSTNLIKHQNRHSLPINKKPSLLLLSLVVCFPDWNIWASTIELNNNNFNQYLNADHPVEGRYRLISDIDLRRFGPWEPVGNKSIPFSLILDGKGHVISGLEISTSTDNTATGLFGSLQNSTIRQILLKQPKVTSTGTNSPTGALVGELKSSRIEEVVNSAGTIGTDGSHSHGGGLAGSVFDSTIHNCLNNGTVTTRGASAGGIAGLADQSSSVSNDLNTGRITSRYISSSPAGGIVGTLRSKSIANNNMNTGEVRVSHTQHSGGIAGEAESAKVLNNLNTGKIASDLRPPNSEGGSSGGIVGKSSGHTEIKQNLNTGSISSAYSKTHAGGIAGQTSRVTVVGNVNVGTVTTNGGYAYAGGIAGVTHGGRIHDNLNAGAIKENGNIGAVGGISGTAFDSASVYDNVNTGSTEAHKSSYKGAAVGRPFNTDRFKNNLNTFTKYSSHEYNKGAKELSKITLKSGLNGLNSTLWNAGDVTQLPMLRGVNTPYRELVRIRTTKQTNNRFPRALNEFADPGGAANATSFNRTVWNGQDGYLPFLKAFAELQILLAGVDCTQGGFDCNKKTYPQLFHEIDIDPNSLPETAAPTPTGRALTRYCPIHRVFSTAWTLNSHHLAVGIGSGKDKLGCPFSGAIQIFEINDSGESLLLHTLSDPKDWVVSVDYNHDGTELAIGTHDDEVRIYDVMNGYTLKKILPHTTGVGTVKYNHDGTLLVAGGSDDKVRVYNVTNDYTLQHVLSDATDDILSIAFNHDGSLLVATAKDGQIRIYVVMNSYTLQQTLPYRTGGALSITFNHDSTLLVAGGNGIRVYRGMSPYTLMDTPPGEHSHSLAFDPSGTRLAAGRDDGQVWIYNGTNPFNLLKILPGAHDRVYSVAYAHNNKWLAVGYRHQKVRIYKVDTPSSSAQPSSSEWTTTSVTHTFPSSDSLSEASTAVPLSSAQPSTSELTTAFVPVNLSSSESSSEASSAVPSSSAQPTTSELNTALAARTSPTSESPSEASSTAPPTTAEPTTGKLTTASVARTSPTSESPSEEASSTVPSSTTQPTTGELTTASVARTSFTSGSPSEEASSTVPPSTTQPTTGELTTASVATTSLTSESPSEEALSSIPSSTAQPTTGELTTAFVARTLPTSESPSEEASFTVPSSTVQTTTDELTTASVARTSSTSESPSEEASSTVPSSTAQPTTGELTTASAARTSSTSESPSEEASSTVPWSTAQPTTSELSTAFVTRASPTSEPPSEASSAVPSSSAQPSTSVARTVQLDNNNFNQYLNADHPVKGHYELISNIDLSRFTHWVPVGNKSVPFSLTLNGNGHVISGLEVSTSADNTTAGLFGSLENSTIRQILLNQPKVTSSGDASPTGALVGEMKQSRIEEVASSAGVIKTSGSGSHAGGIVGSVSDNSIIRDSLNTGTVITTGIACAGGITGLAEQASVISNNLNTGKITPRNLHDSPAGGIVGRLKISSLAYNNLNIGEVNVGHTENSGGIAGEAEAARVVQNLNTGKIASDYLDGTSQRGGGNVGGIVGEASSHSLVSNNLNTGSIYGKYGSHVGGITGRVVNTTAVQNVNVGPVTTEGKFAYAGGIAGKASGESIYDNLNAGSVVGRGRSGPVAGISGTARGANVYNNVNTGLIKTYYYDNRKSAAVANIRKAGRIENNLDTFTKNRSVLTFVEWDGYNTGVVRVPRDVLKSNLSGLSSELWNSGDSSQLPMLKNINIPYRELARINGTKQANNQFPRALNEFADPGGNSNATFFSRTVWNSQDGYLPFLKAFFGAQTLLAGIDCTPGGFDCSEKKEITPSASSSSSEKPSASLPDNCPLPEGTPLFQTYDRENQRIYVVIQPESHEPSGIILARYQGTELDKQFGSCGTVKYTTSVNQAKILDSYQSLTGQVIHETTGPHLDIVATTTSGKATLLEFPLTAAQRDQARLRVHKNLFPDNVQINDSAYHQGVMYLTGSIDNSLFVGRYLQRRLYFREKYPEDKEEGLHLRLSPDGKRLYVAGKSDQDASYPLFISKYDSKQLNPATSFGNNGKEIMVTNDMFNSQYLLIQKDQSYLAVFSPEGGKLSIRRFATENGQIDSAFIIDDRIDFSSRTKGSTTAVRLITRDDLLHAIIYDSDGQVYVVTYQNQVNVHRFDTTFVPAAAKSMRPVFVGNNVYLAVENADIEKGSRLVRMQEISLEIENYNYQVSPIAFSPERSTEGMSGLGIGFIAAGSVTVATIAIILAIKKFKRQRFGSGTETHELLSLDKF